MRWHETSGTSMVVIRSVARAVLPDIDLLALPGRAGLNGTRARSHRLALLSLPARTGKGNPSLCCRYCDRIYEPTAPR